MAAVDGLVRDEVEAPTLAGCQGDHHWRLGAIACLHLQEPQGADRQLPSRNSRKSFV
jgi:hypothetical protein